jgi:hypothetical protein
MPQAEFEPTIPASERPQTHTLDLRLGLALTYDLRELIIRECENT